MSIITLTSDAGNGYYAGSVKGTIYSSLQDVTVVDITHAIEPFDMLQAAFIVKNTYSDFPKGTIHIVDVNSFPEEGAKNCLFFFDGHFFIGADNGLFPLIFDTIPEKIMELILVPDARSLAFPMRDVFAKAACHIAKDLPLEEIAKPLEKLKERSVFKPSIDKNSIRGIIIFIDHYKNVVCNISREIFENVRQGRKFSIATKGTSVEDISVISEKYNDVQEGEIVAFFGSTGFLEIAINQGAAGNLLNLKKNDQITIRFDD
ncbi:MAG: SAM-dependent chlorinase/fluorinase [Bacteroidia bacterium]